jgi:hypothetical protein
MSRAPWIFGGGVELAGERSQLVECASVIVERPRPAQPLLHRRPVALGQMVGDVALLVPFMPTSA